MMKMKLLALAIALAGALGIGAMAATPSYAASGDFFKGCTKDVDCSVAKTSKKLDTSVWNIVSAALGLLGGIAVIVVIIGGIMYTTSNGDAGKVKAAKTTILYAVVGVVVAFMASGIIALVNDYFAK